MLTIKRVPTIVSNYQEENPEKIVERVAKGCGRNCLGKCCLPSSMLPLYAIKKDNGEHPIASGTSSGQYPQISSLLSLLLGQWEDKMNQGLFRYDVTTCKTKIISGKHGFITQQNEGRQNKKRPTEFRVDQVLQPFDETKFNFTKVGQKEVLFMFEQSNDYASHFIPSTPVASISDSPNVVAINVSPIEYGHILLIPRVLDCLPQRIGHSSLLLAIQLAKEVADPFFRVGYNSLGAFATVNHLHFQAYYLAAPFPVEKALTQQIATAGRLKETGVIVSQLLGYPVRGLLFEGGNSMLDRCTAVASSCIFLQSNNIPFNVLISNYGERVFLFPQCYAEKQALGEVSQELMETQVNPAVWEISGHIVLKRSEDYDKASEAYARRLLAEVSLSEERFQEVKAYILEAAGLQEMDVKLGSGDCSDEEETLLESPGTTPHLLRDCLVQQ